MSVFHENDSPRGLYIMTFFIALCCQLLICIKHLFFTPLSFTHKMWGENSWITQCLSFFYFTIFSKPFDILFSVFSNLLGFSVHNLHQTLIFFPYVFSANKVWRELSINDIINFPNYFPILSLIFFHQFTVYDRNHYFGLGPTPNRNLN